MAQIDMTSRLVVWCTWTLWDDCRCLLCQSLDIRTQKRLVGFSKNLKRAFHQVRKHVLLTPMKHWQVRSRLHGQIANIYFARSTSSQILMRISTRILSRKQIFGQQLAGGGRLFAKTRTVLYKNHLRPVGNCFLNISSTMATFHLKSLPQPKSNGLNAWDGEHISGQHVLHGVRQFLELIWLNVQRQFTQLYTHFVANINQ